MCKSIFLAAIAMVLAGAGAATQPAAFDGKVYAMSLAGIYPHEDVLIRQACDDNSDDFDRDAATQAAICNEWNGPFRLRDFALWLKSTHLDKRLRLETTNWDSDGSFKHLPSGMRKLSLALRVATPITAVVFALDSTQSFADVESILNDPAKAPDGGGPVVYCVEPDEVFPEAIIARDKQ